jgi:hypothetical protein
MTNVKLLLQAFLLTYYRSKLHIFNSHVRRNHIIRLQNQHYYMLILTTASFSYNDNNIVKQALSGTKKLVINNVPSYR